MILFPLIFSFWISLMIIQIILNLNQEEKQLGSKFTNILKKFKSVQHPFLVHHSLCKQPNIFFGYHMMSKNKTFFPPVVFIRSCHRGMNTRDKNWLLWKGPTVCCLIYVLCHNFWTNYDLDLFNTSKWPSELQFCERYLCRWRKIG